MRELYIEGPAIHGGPESCGGAREGVGEALAGVRVGWAIEPRNQRFGVPTPYNQAEGNIGGRVSASGWRTLRGLRPCACAESPCARTGRPDGRPLASNDAPSYGFAGWRAGVGRVAGGRPVAVSPR
jgi:hypothetical protein